MSPNIVLALVIRLFAVALAIYNFQTIFLSLDTFPSISSKLAIAWFGISLIIAAVLWRFPLSFASGILGKDAPASEKHVWGSDELYDFGIVLVGLFWLVKALYDSVYWIGFCIYVMNFELLDMSMGIGPDNTASIIGTVFEIVIALSLIIGSTGWRRLLVRIKYGRQRVK